MRGGGVEEKDRRKETRPGRVVGAVCGDVEWLVGGARLFSGRRRLAMRFLFRFIALRKARWLVQAHLVNSITPAYSKKLFRQTGTISLSLSCQSYYLTSAPLMFTYLEIEYSWDTAASLWWLFLSG